jgi:hypothetical protein
MQKYLPEPSSQYTQTALSRAVEHHLGELAEVVAANREVMGIVYDEIARTTVTGAVTMANVVRSSDHLRWDMTNAGHQRQVFHDFMDKLEQITGESVLMVTATGHKGMIGHLLRSIR